MYIDSNIIQLCFIKADITVPHRVFLLMINKFNFSVKKTYENNKKQVHISLFFLSVKIPN